MTDLEFELAFAEFWASVEKELKKIIPNDALTEEEEKKYRRRAKIKRFLSSIFAGLRSLRL